jgi:hypothetical protein
VSSSNLGKNIMLAGLIFQGMHILLAHSKSNK